MDGMNKSSTERVQRFRQRQRDAGNRRITLYLDHETQRKLDQLAGGQAQAGYLETLVKTAIKREWTALASRRNDGEPRQRLDDRRTVFLGRRRSLFAGR
jgi:hypothetical protein